MDGYAIGNMRGNNFRNGFNVRLLEGSVHYERCESNVGDVKIGKKYILTGSYDGENVKFLENGIQYIQNVKGVIKKPGLGTLMSIGGEPSGNKAVEWFFSGKIYSVRIYNRALTDEEIKHNCEVDKNRFNVIL